MKEKGIDSNFVEIKNLTVTLFNQLSSTNQAPNQAEISENSAIPSLRKNTYGITLILPNQNISIWMAPLPTETPGTHQHITTSSPVFNLSEPFHNHESY